MREAVARSLSVGDVFSVIGSENVYIVTSIHGVKEFVEGELACKHTDDGIPVVKLDFSRKVRALDGKDKESHYLHTIENFTGAFFTSNISPIYEQNPAPINLGFNNSAYIFQIRLQILFY